MSLAVANRYARALADAVMAPGSGLEPADAIAGLNGFSSAIQSSAELRTILTSPAVATVRKRSVVGKLCDSTGAHKLIRNFLFVVVDHRRVAALPEIAKAFESAVDERLGRIRASITSAQPLDEASSEALRAELARMTGKQVRCEFAVNPELIGGVSVRIGSTIYDGSARGQLDALGARLSARS